MSLAPGTRLGPYEIQSPGGMGEVYKAKDTHLDRTMRLCRSLVLLPGLLAIFIFAWPPDAVSAQAEVILPDRSIAAARIDVDEAPTIDGDLSDLSWTSAAVLDDFRQVQPDTGAPATERTVLRIMYDENNLYFGIYAYDSEPDLIILRSMARDAEIYTGDNVGFFLDPGPTRRNAYSFQISPSGGRNDSLYLNNSEELEDWDPIWDFRTRVVDDGWVAEIAIPFQSLSYEAGETDWGFDVSRSIRRKNEDVQWAVQNPALDFTDVSQAGTLTGIRDVNRGLGLDVQAYGVTRARRDWHVPGEDTDLSVMGGGNAFYRITSSLTGTLTFNPDFSDAPLDARQINTTRFSLFFPETRDFFLQDAGAFEFGGRGFSRGFDRTANNGRPFFTRNIGLVNGEQVDVVAGGKLSGTFEGFNIGALSVLTGDTPTSSGQVLSVARITRPVFTESRMGIVITDGDPTGASDNTVVGTDFQYRSSNWLGGGIFQSDAYFERSLSSSRGEDNIFGLALDYPNEPWGWDADFKHVGANFEPALGFINRTDIRRYQGNLYRRKRFQDHFLRVIEFGGGTTSVTNLDGRLESRESRLSALAQTTSEYSYRLDVVNIFENVSDPFEVADILVPAGRDTWTNVRATFMSSGARALSIGIDASCCSFYSGDAIETALNTFYRPNEFYEIVAGWEATFLDLPGGKVDIHVLTSTVNVNFTPYMKLDLQVQYDNDSEEFGFLSRYRWEINPGDEFFVAFGQAAQVPGSRFIAQRTQFSVRLGRTFRY